MDELKAKLDEYGIDSTRVIGKTPQTFSGDRGREIHMWMDEHPEVTKFVIFDDNYICHPYQPNHVDTGPNFVKSHWNIGLTLTLAVEAVKILGGKDKSDSLYLE